MLSKYCCLENVPTSNSLLIDATHFSFVHICSSYCIRYYTPVKHPIYRSLFCCCGIHSNTKTIPNEHTFKLTQADTSIHMGAIAHTHRHTLDTRHRPEYMCMHTNKETENHSHTRQHVKYYRKHTQLIHNRELCMVLSYGGQSSANSRYELFGFAVLAFSNFFFSSFDSSCKLKCFFLRCLFILHTIVYICKLECV